jgi:hypothetical protein
VTKNSTRLEGVFFIAKIHSAVGLKLRIFCAQEKENYGKLKIR